MEDATITRLFRSPVKNTLTPSEGASQPLQYPALPQSDIDEVEPDVPILSYVDGQYVEMQELPETEAVARDIQLDADEDEEVKTEVQKV